MRFSNTIKLTKFIFAAVILTSMPALAQTAAPAPAVDILPAKTVNVQEQSDNSHTHPPVRLTPDKSELIRLDGEAATIIVGNPAHLSVLAESSKTLVLIARAPGATHFTAMDAKGNVVMQRHVIVASPKKEYVRIRRSCAGSGDDCAETSVFYCPDMCHEVAVRGPESQSNTQPSTADATGGTGGGLPAGNVEETPDDTE